MILRLRCFVLMFPSYRILCWNRLRSGGQDQELGNEQQGCVTVEPGSESVTEAGDHAMEKTESVNERLDLGIGTKNVDVETNESDEKVPVDSQEVVTAKGETEHLVDKEEVEPDMVSSNGTNLSDVNGSELGEDSKLVSSGKQATIVDNLEDECLGGLKLYESSLDDDNAPVTAKVKPLVDKEEVEPDMVSSHGTILSDVKSSDLGEDSKPVSSGAKQGAIVDNLEDECLGGLKLYESILDDDNASPVTTKVNLSDSDLVWAKVRSHPWWPAQVFDPSAATDKANKYFKKGSFLVTYFGDCTFAWIDASRIKPFRQNFSQMAKQSTLPDFRHAIDVALEEVSRRIQFGLACSCNSEDVYQKIKTQNIINPGIREDASTIHGGDKLSSAVFFEPADLVDYVKRLAYSPNYDAKDELNFFSKRAQLLALTRWKGYTDLPEFETLQWSVESAPKAKTSPAEEIMIRERAAPVTAKVRLSDSDLVWAKVRSHPWWPAQVFDASAATDKANKDFKKGSFLVTYFGDRTTWVDASRIKPFRQNFSQMAKQSTLPDFRRDIGVALKEVSRRIEFGLACSCISVDVYQKIKTQKIISPGIREDASTIHGGDKLSSAVFFEPADLVDYMKRLAYSPNYDAKDELQFVSKRAQLLAFNRWKGYTDLPEFETLQGSVNSAPKAKTSPAEEKSSFLVVKVSDPEPKKSKQVYTNKRRRTEGQDEDTTVPKKKHKTLVEFTAEKRSSKHGTSSGHCFGGTSSAPDGESEDGTRSQQNKNGERSESQLMTNTSFTPRAVLLREKKGGERELHTRSFTTKTKSNKEETLCWHPDRKVFSYGLCKECFKAYQREKEPYYCNLRKSAKSFSGSQQNKDDQPLMERDVSFIPRVVRLTKLREAAAHQVGSGKGHADESGNSSDKVHINQLPDPILEEIFSRVVDTKCCFEVCKSWFVLNRARQTSLIILPAPIPFFPLKDRGFRDLTSVTINHRLAVNGTHLITDNDLMKLAEEFPKLQILDLIRCDLITPMGLINVIERCKSLKWLYLQPPPHFDDEAVVAVKDCFLDTRLRILLLGIVPRSFEFVFK